MTLGKEAEAESAYKQALEIRTRLNDASGFANTLANLGFMYSQHSEYAKALKYYGQALPIEEGLGDKSGAAWTHHYIGVAYRAQGEIDKSLDQLNQALAIRKAIGEVGPMAGTLNVIGDIFLDQGDTDKAQAEYELALTAYRTVPDRVGEATTLVNFGVVQARLGAPLKAISYYEKALALQTGAKDVIGMASTLGNLGVVYDQLGQRGKALDYYSQALLLTRRLKDREREATTLGNIGSVYRDLGDTTTALDYIQKAIAIDREIGSKPGLAALLNTLAAAYSDSGEAENAVTTENKSLELAKELGDRALEALDLNNLGNYYLDAGRNPEALKSFQSAMELAEATGNKATQATLLNNIGEVQYRLGNAGEALSAFTNAISMDRAIGDRAAEAASCANLLTFFEKHESPGLAILNGKLAVNIFQSLRRDASGVSKTTQSAYKQTLEPTYRELARLLAGAGRISEAEQVLDLLKDSEFYRFLGTRAATGASSVNLSPFEKTWAEKYDGIFNQVASLSAEFDALTRIPPSKLTPEQKARVKAINEKLIECNKALGAYFAGAKAAFGKVNASPERIEDLEASATLTGVLKQLPGHAAAVYTIVTADGVHLLLNLPNGSVYRSPAMQLPAAELNEKIVAFRQALQDPRVDPRPLGAELYELVVRPIEQDLVDAHVDSLMWSLDSRLRYIPIWALYDAKAGKYLLEKYPSSLFTPRTLEKQTRDEHGADWKGAEFGVSQGRSVGALAFAALPGVPSELKGVSEEIGGEPLLDAKFTRDSLDEALLGKPRVLHIATHFNFVPGDDKDSFLLLGSGELSVDDFKAMRNGALDGVELLVLSACNTANGDIRASAADGGEFESFALLAQLKGADSVLASLWPVSDSSTAVLMKEFYRLRKANPAWTKLEALRQTQIEMMQGKLTAAEGEGQRAGSVKTTSVPKELPLWTGKGFSHPFYWAPFELTGNWK